MLYAWYISSPQHTDITSFTNKYRIISGIFDNILQKMQSNFVAKNHAIKSIYPMLSSIIKYTKAWNVFI